MSSLTSSQTKATFLTPSKKVGSLTRSQNSFTLHLDVQAAAAIQNMSLKTPTKYSNSSLMSLSDDVDEAPVINDVEELRQRFTGDIELPEGKEPCICIAS
jgi:hypothetical protein